jgi:hypothetical protein
MLKRRLEAFALSRHCGNQRREQGLKVLTHNVMILLRIKVSTELDGSYIARSTLPLTSSNNEILFPGISAALLPVDSESPQGRSGFVPRA